MPVKGDERRLARWGWAAGRPGGWPGRDTAAKLKAAAARNRVDLVVAEAALGAEPGTAELLGDPA